MTEILKKFERNPEPSSLNFELPYSGTFFAKAWWINYMVSCAEALEKLPIRSTVARPHLLVEYHRQISTGMCLNCRQVDHHRLQAFALFMEKKIDERISKVTIFFILAVALWNLTSIYRSLFRWHISNSHARNSQAVIYKGE